MSAFSFLAAGNHWSRGTLSSTSCQGATPRHESMFLALMRKFSKAHGVHISFTKRSNQIVSALAGFTACMDGLLVEIIATGERKVGLAHILLAPIPNPAHIASKYAHGHSCRPSHGPLSYQAALSIHHNQCLLTTTVLQDSNCERTP